MQKKTYQILVLSNFNQDTNEIVELKMHIFKPNYCIRLYLTQKNSTTLLKQPFFLFYQIQLSFSDYLFLWTQALNRGKYFIQLEDDIIARKGFLNFIAGKVFSVSCLISKGKIFKVLQIKIVTQRTL